MSRNGNNKKQEGKNLSGEHLYKAESLKSFLEQIVCDILLKIDVLIQFSLKFPQLQNIRYWGHNLGRHRNFSFYSKLTRSS